MAPGAGTYLGLASSFVLRGGSWLSKSGLICTVADYINKGYGCSRGSCIPIRRENYAGSIFGDFQPRF